MKIIRGYKGRRATSSGTYGDTDADNLDDAARSFEEDEDDDDECEVESRSGSAGKNCFRVFIRSVVKCLN